MVLAVTDVAEIFEEAGLHPSVLFTVNQLEIADYTASIDITLRYLKSKPVCCPEPGCYIPALRPGGMDLVLTRIQQRSGHLVLDLRLTVHQEYEAGYQYQYLKGIFEANDEVITYTYP